MKSLDKDSEPKYNRGMYSGPETFERSFIVFNYMPVHRIQSLF